MPKIIEGVREQLLSVAREQISTQGYKKTTIRSVAGACGLGVGTVYNYFASKDMLIASFMLEDWQRCLARMKSVSTEDAETAAENIYRLLSEFIDMHRALFSDEDAAKVFSTVFSERHGQLRSQIAAVLRPLCERAEVRDKDFLAEFTAEALLSWTVEGKPFESLFPVLSLLLK